MDMNRFNPWWIKGAVPRALIGKERMLLDEVRRYLDLRQMLIFTGLRRAGKTTIMFQIIDELLEREKVNPARVIYFSFDEEVESISDIVAEYEATVLRGRVADQDRVYLIFDEIQKLKGWPDQVKLLYDMLPNAKILISGSAAINLKKGTRESLAGRFFDFHVEPLDFDEYLEFKEIEVDRRREGIFEIEIKKALSDYLATGGFIETLDLGSERAGKYFRESLLERVVYRDLPQEFAIKSTGLLYRLISIAADRPGMLLDYRNLAGDLGYDQRTISEYYSYLEYGLLVRKLYNYSPNLLTSEKKLKRVYPSSTAFTVALSRKEDLPHLLEQFYAQVLRARFFSRTPQKEEVDLVTEVDGAIVPVEVKIRNDVKKRDATPVFKFCAKNGLKRGVIISGRDETVFRQDGLEVLVIPYWKYWTIRKVISQSAGDGQGARR